MYNFKLLFREERAQTQQKAHCVARRGLGDQCSVLDSSWLVVWLLQLKASSSMLLPLLLLKQLLRRFKTLREEALFILKILADLNFLLNQ